MKSYKVLLKFANQSNGLPTLMCCEIFKELCRATDVTVMSTQSIRFIFNSRSAFHRMYTNRQILIDLSEDL